MPRPRWPFNLDARESAGQRAGHPVPGEREGGVEVFRDAIGDGGQHSAVAAHPGVNERRQMCARDRYRGFPFSGSGENLLAVVTGEHHRGVCHRRGGERENQVEHMRFACDILKLVNAQRLILGEVGLFSDGFQRPLREGFAIPGVVGIRGVCGEAADSEHDGVEVVDVNKLGAPPNEIPELFGHEHVPACEQRRHAQVAGEAHGSFNE